MFTTISSIYPDTAPRCQTVAQVWYDWNNFVASIIVLMVNLFIYPWASREGVVAAVCTLGVTNALDLVLVGDLHVRKRDVATIAHHVIVVIVAYLIYDPTAVVTPAHRRLWQYSLPLEIASCTTSLRHLTSRSRIPYVKSMSNALFVVVFFTTRTWMTIGCAHVLWTTDALPGRFAYLFFWYIMSCLNLYWGRQILHRIWYSVRPKTIGWCEWIGFSVLTIIAWEMNV